MPTDDLQITAVTPKPIFTIGHSNHDIPTFLNLLRANHIQVVVDVRSAPYSRYATQYNKNDIESALKENGFKYIFMGDLIGGKPRDPAFYGEDGKADYAIIAKTPAFQEGIARLRKGIEDGWVIALMCAEENPGNCHRHWLISKELELNHTIPVYHLRADGSIMRAGEMLTEDPQQMKLF